MLNAPPPPPPRIEYAEQAPVGFNYSTRHVGEYSSSGNYLMANPPFLVEGPSDAFCLLVASHAIDSSGHKRFDDRVNVKDAIAKEFGDLVTIWRKETSFQSSLALKFTHRAYQRIMAMGKPALPLILRELQHRPSHWFYALKFIQGTDVAKGMDNLEDAREAWLEWGRQEKLI